MACCNPQFIQQKYTLFGYKTYQVPCGWCLNCRKDKQNYIIDRAIFEYKKRLTASFVTFTYDDIHLLSQCAVLDEFNSPIFDYDENNKKTLRASLNYSDVTHFIDSIRKYVLRHSELHGVCCQPDFSYMYVGEYGDIFNRPHFHVLFFGLDFAFCKKLLFSRWQYGFIDVLPLLDGGISYVTKYLDKQVHGSLAFETYDSRGLSRPRLRLSQGFGKGLLTENIKDIKENNYTYKTTHNLRRPISAYWKSLITGNNPFLDVTKTYKYKKMNLDKINLELKNYHQKLSNDFLIARSQSRDWSVSKAKKREYNMRLMLRSKNIPTENYELPLSSRFGNPSYNHDKIRKLPISIQKLVQECFLESLWSDDIPF